jgi:uncharacterized OB-fold protein
MSGPRFNRNKDENEHLVGYECQECGWVAFPVEKRICKRCGDPRAEYEKVDLAEEGEIKTYVVQKSLPNEFEVPQPVAIVDIPQASGSGEPARVYGILTETKLEELEVGKTVEARFREMFTDNERPIHSFKFSTPREEKA